MRYKEMTTDELISELKELHRQNAELRRAEEQRMLTEEALRTSEERFRNFLDNLGDIAYETDASGNVTYANKVSEKITGVPLEDITGRPFLPLFTSNSQEIAQEVYRRTLAGESPEFELTFTNGRICHFKNEPLRDENGKIKGVFGIARDITKRMRTHEAVRQRNRELSLLNRISKAFSSTLHPDELLIAILEELHRLFRVVACSVWLLDNKTGELVCRQSIGPWSDSVCGLRLSPGEGIAGWVVQNGESLIIPDIKVDKRHYRRIDRDTKSEMRSLMLTPLRTKESVLGVLEVADTEVDRFNQRDMNLIESLAGSAAIAVENARLYEAVHQELTDRIKAQNALRESEQKFRALFDHLPILAFVVDGNHRLIACNESFCAIMGDQVGKRTLELERVSKRAKDFWHAVEKQVIESGLSTWFTELFQFVNRDRAYYDKRMQPIKDQNGKVSMVVNIATDISNEVKRQIALAEKVKELRIQVSQEADSRIVGRSKPILEVLSRVEAIAATDTTLLLTGESGTGKELVADTIHRASKRSSGPLIRINCAALPETIIESELFGHVKGAFSGAISTRLGRFEAANNGTLFLDEIGDISPAVQLRLLRVLEERRIEKVGDHKSIAVDVRIIAATNQNLTNLMGTGRFRKDLYYRLNVFRIHLPPLRERVDDIPLLVAHFLSQYAKTMGKKITSVSDRVMNRLLHHSWPGNVRELMNVIESACVVCHGRTIQQEHLSLIFESRPLDFEMDREMEIRQALRNTKGNKAKAASLLGIARTTLYRRMKRYGIVAD
jgi:PAS domain S-box-containing protein